MKCHAYCHGDLPFVCNVCNEGFAFKSELKFHKTVHRKVYSFHCVAKNCGKSYKSSNELNKHAQVFHVTVVSVTIVQMTGETYEVIEKSIKRLAHTNVLRAINVYDVYVYLMCFFRYVLIFCMSVML